MKTLGLKVPKTSTQDVIRALSVVGGAIDPGRKIKSRGGHVFIPIIESSSGVASETLSRAGLDHEVVLHEFEERRPRQRTLAGVLDGVLPDEIFPLLPHSWDLIGDVLVFDVQRENRAALETHLAEIGRGLMEVHPNVKSVFMKGGDVGGDFRIRPLQWVAGKDSAVTTYKENGCRFRVDLHEVFFTPRLVTERARVTALASEDPCPVVDLFAGVGSFVVQIAKNCGVRCIAFDLNPRAVELCRENASLNGVDELVKCVEGDARGAPEVVKEFPREFGGRRRVIMNLPERSLEFLETAVSLVKETSGWVHIYQFSGTDNPVSEAIASVERSLNGIRDGSFTWKVVRARVVKPYSPRKYTTVVDLVFLPTA
ncbi:MAG: class I SAM-dependent methyltransferase [Promethearchaeota archaeon]